MPFSKCPARGTLEIPEADETTKMDEDFWAEVDVEAVEPDQFRAVLVLGLRTRLGDDNDVIRIPLTGEHPTADEARAAARAAIAAMGQGGQ